MSLSNLRRAQEFQRRLEIPACPQGSLPALVEAGERTAKAGCVSARVHSCVSVRQFIKLANLSFVSFLGKWEMKQPPPRLALRRELRPSVECFVVFC